MASVNSGLMAEGLNRAANALSGSRAGALPAPKNDDELWEAVKLYFNVEIPRRKVCEHHEAPFTAFADAYFARNTVTVWKASRGFGGKSMLLALLGLCESVFLGAKVNILGGSGEQSERVLNYINGEEMPEAFWNAPDAPKHLIVGGADSEVADNARGVTKKMIKLTNGGYLKALMASSRSVRGPHPQRLRLDEVDEMDLSIFDSALGQPMKRFGIEEQVVASSTHHYANGTMTEILKRSIEKGWKTYEWCAKPDGLIVLADGSIKEIQHITVGDYVLSASKLPRMVTKIWTRPVDEDMVSFRVFGSPEPIVLTANHEILTIRGRVCAGNLQNNDLLVDEHQALPDTGDTLAGWTLGVYLAEGHRVDEHGIELSVHASEANAIATRMQEWWTRLQPKYKLGAVSFGPTIRQTPNSANGAIVRIHHPLVRELIDRWVSGSSAATKQLKSRIDEGAFGKAVLRGWLDGDGWMFRGNEVGQTSSVQLAWQMRYLAESVGFHANVTKVQNRPGPTARARGETVGKSAWRVSIFTTPRKRRVHSITTEHYVGLVYDITVDVDHTFLAGGVPVANCYRENLISNGGWLDDSAVDRKKKTVTLSMWDAEYENQEPNPQGRAIDPDKCKLAFRSDLGIFNGDEHEHIEIEAPYMGGDPEHTCHRCAHPYGRRDTYTTSCDNCGTDRRVTKRGIYAHGADWAKKRDWTVIWTFRTDIAPVRLVAFERTGRLPWPVMIGKFETRVKRFGGAACHDMTGIGGVIDDYLTVGSEGVIMQGLPRHELLSHYITAIEHGRLEMPMIKWVYDSHRLASVEDVFRAGDAYHLPDDMSAGALAWKASGLGAVGEIYIPKLDPKTGRVTVTSGRDDD